MKKIKKLSPKKALKRAIFLAKDKSNFGNQ